jgi:hypothetical protein
MFYTYYHGCHGNIFVPNNLCKKKNKNNLRKKKDLFEFFFIFHKNLGGKYVAMATTIKCVSKVLISGMFTKCFTHIIMVAMATYLFPIICVKRKIFKSNPFFLYYF